MNDFHWREVHDRFRSLQLSSLDGAARRGLHARLEPRTDTTSGVAGLFKTASTQLARSVGVSSRAVRSNLLAPVSADSITSVGITEQPPAASSGGTRSAGDMLYVAGFRDDKSGVLQMGPVIRIPEGFLSDDRLRAIAEQMARTLKDGAPASALKLQLLDAAANVIKTADLILAEGFDADGSEPKGFAALLPIPDETTRVRMVDAAGKDLWSTSNTDASKTEVSAVEGSVHDGHLTVNWSSEGSTDRTHLVQYSADGSTWSTIGINHAGSTLEVDSSHLPGSRKAQVRVLVVAGLASHFMVSKPFVVERKQPRAAIVTPVKDHTFSFGTPILAIGFAEDAEDGTLPDANLLWSVEDVGPVGTGREVLLPLLPPGRHRLRLTAIDSDKGTTIAEEEFVVTLTPSGR
jgi:hypothetical protein